MKQTSKANSAAGTRPERRAKHTAQTGGGRLAFNPLHPSMELPPEQLIRLLSLETKKTRRSTARHSKPRPQKPTRATLSHDETPAPEPARPTMRAQRSYSASAQHAFDDKRSGLLLPAVAAGVLAGLAASAYFFWYQPSPMPSQDTAKIVAKPGAQRPQPAEQATRPAAPPEKLRSHATRAAGSAAQAEQAASALASGKVRRDDAEWRAAAEAERLRLQAEAEQRFAERLRQSRRNPETVPPSAADNTGLPLEPAAPTAVSPGAEPSAEPSWVEPGPAVALPLEPGGDGDPVPPRAIQAQPEPARAIDTVENRLPVTEPPAVEATRSQAEAGLGIQPPKPAAATTEAPQVGHREANPIGEPAATGALPTQPGVDEQAYRWTEEPEAAAAPHTRPGAEDPIEANAPASEEAPEGDDKSARGGTGLLAPVPSDASAAPSIPALTPAVAPHSDPGLGPETDVRAYGTPLAEPASLPDNPSETPEARSEPALF